MPLWFLPVFNDFAVTAALPFAFFPARRCRPITLLGLPSRPSPRLPPARFAAIALARLARAKPMLATFQQTAAGARTADRPFPPAVFLILLRACRILVRAHGSVAPGKLIPRRGLASSPGRSSSGSVQTQDSIAPETGAARPFCGSLFPACGGAGCQISKSALSLSPPLWVARFGTSGSGSACASAQNSQFDVAGRRPPRDHQFGARRCFDR